MDRLLSHAADALTFTSKAPGNSHSGGFLIETQVSVTLRRNPRGIRKGRTPDHLPGSIRQS